MTKGQIALEEVKKAPTFMGGNPKNMASTKAEELFMEDIGVIEKELIEGEENGSALTIAREKYVDFWVLNASFTVDQYNAQIARKDGSYIFCLTPGEFYLLKKAGVKE